MPSPSLPLLRRLGFSVGATLLLLAAAPAAAANPEQVQDLGPKKRQWSLEYVGQFGSANGSDEGRQHSGELYYAISDSLVIGGETQLSYRSGPLVNRDGLFFDYDSVIALLRFSDVEKDPVGAGLWLQAALDSDGEVARLETRFILEKKTDAWRTAANAMLRRVNEEEEEGTLLAYSGRISHAVAPNVWLGAEASGQAARISGFRREPLDSGHYLGPSLAFEFPLGGRAEAQLGLSYLHRIDEDEGLRNVAQLSAQLRF
ncbi:MAG: hypothetical protein M3Q08_06965 [Pseudomonadota bacterium]|nr:hypothetical protein [Pseudomonadota bacterium]